MPCGVTKVYVCNTGQVKWRMHMSGSSLKRFSVSMEGDLLNSFDHLVTLRGYENRSEAVRDLVREAIVKQSYENSEQIIAGSILLFYDHERRNLMEVMTEVEHNTHDIIL